MPKKKYKLFKRKKDSDVLGIQVTTIKDGVPTFNVAITEEETPLVVFLNTIYHEIEHVKQKDKLLTARYPLSINMILTKEFLASLNKVYYKSNYNKLVTEINARLMGRKKTEWLIKDKDSSNSLGVRNYIDENLKKVYILDDDIGEISLSEKTDCSPSLFTDRSFLTSFSIRESRFSNNKALCIILFIMLYSLYNRFIII